MLPFKKKGEKDIILFAWRIKLILLRPVIRNFVLTLTWMQTTRILVSSPIILVANQDPSQSTAVSLTTFGLALYLTKRVFTLTLHYGFVFSHGYYIRQFITLVIKVCDFLPWRDRGSQSWTHCLTQCSSPHSKRSKRWIGSSLDWYFVMWLLHH